MTNLSAPELDKWKESCAKDGITYGNDEEYIEAITNIIGYIELLAEIDHNQRKQAEKTHDTTDT